VMNDKHGDYRIVKDETTGHWMVFVKGANEDFMMIFSSKKEEKIREFMKELAEAMIRRKM